MDGRKNGWTDRQHILCFLPVSPTNKGSIKRDQSQAITRISSTGQQLGGLTRWVNQLSANPTSLNYQPATVSRLAAGRVAGRQLNGSWLEG